MYVDYSVCACAYLQSLWWLDTRYKSTTKAPAGAAWNSYSQRPRTRTVFKSHNLPALLTNVCGWTERIDSRHCVVHTHVNWYYVCACARARVALSIFIDFPIILLAECGWFREHGRALTLTGAQITRKMIPNV